MAIEEVYFGRNVRSAMAVGQASGVAMLAAAQRGVACFAYTPQAIKMAVCGSGGAGKDQVQRMVGTLLGLPEPPARPRRRRPRGRDLPRRRHSASTQPWLPATRRAPSGAVADDRRGARRGDGAPARPRRHRRGRRRLPAGGLLRDPESRCRRRGKRDAFLHAELIAREDSLALYGFASEEERDLFRLLISVSGDRAQGGDRDALAAAAPASCCGRSRPATRNGSRRCPAIGKRTSERIIVELREKVAGRAGGGGRRRRCRGERRSALARPRRAGQPRLRAAGGRAAAGRRRGRRAPRSWSRRRCAEPPRLRGAA